MKKILTILALPFFLVSCNNSNNSTSFSPSTKPSATSNTTSISNKDSNQSSKESNNSNSSNEETINAKALVIYFSASGNTEKVAQTISNHIDSPLYELEPVNPYTSSDLNYSNQSSRVSQEHLQRVAFRNGEREDDVHVELKNTLFEGFENAEYIFLGAPVWWQELSWVIDDFVSNNDFTGKTIIPFGTSSASSFSVDNLKSLNSTGTWHERQRFSSSVSSSNVISWIDSLEYKF